MPRFFAYVDKITDTLPIIVVKRSKDRSEKYRDGGGIMVEKDMGSKKSAAEVGGAD